ncbi:hypothetical protein I79_021554 [Cricetulus griseus]|uniref:Uncharacterized protein n=1 Tax=Cricetulus griseus TaxID=10029 RepID=G3ICZ3_CRIGR|nr:hypothetical protein I79_021554 [Cricetulus griseus]
MAGPGEYFISSKYGSAFSRAHSHIPNPKCSSLNAKAVRLCSDKPHGGQDLFLTLA